MPRRCDRVKAQRVRVLEPREGPALQVGQADPIPVGSALRVSLVALVPAKQVQAEAVQEVARATVVARERDIIRRFYTRA